MTTADAPHDAGLSKASPAYRKYVVWLLFLIALVNFLDRQIVNILAEPIKRDLGLSDLQLGLLTGLAFASLYTITGIPIALIADRTNRARVITGALLIWSTFTAACGMAQNFTQLLIARVVVGLGESGCQPPSLSLIADYAPKTERASAMGHYSLGIAVGGLVAVAAGGVLADQLGWRAAFFLAGLPGVALALLAAFTLKDPRRGSAAPTQPPGRGIRECLAELRGNSVFWWICLASAAKALVSYGQGAFLGSFFLRVHKQGLADVAATVSQATGLHLGPLAFVGLGLGLIAGIGGVAGTWLGGQLGDRFGRQDMTALLLIPAVAAPLAIPFQVMAFLTSDTGLALLLLIPPGLLGSLWLGPTFAALQSVVRPDTRATAAALQSSFVLFLGLGLGPLCVGALSDHLGTTLGEASGVRWSLVACSMVGLLAALLFWLGSRKLKASVIS